MGAWNNYDGLTNALQRPHLKVGRPKPQGKKNNGARLYRSRPISLRVCLMSEKRAIRGWRFGVRSIAWFRDWRLTTPECRRGRRSNAE